MAESPFGFAWDVPEGGHMIVEQVVPFDKNRSGRYFLAERKNWDAGPQPILCEARSTREENPRWYHPLDEEPALFRTFADIDPTPDGCLHFANKYGLLGIGSLWGKDAPLPDRAKPAERVREWRMR